MDMFGYMFFAFMLEMVVFTVIGSKLFPGSSSLDFPSNEEYYAHGMKQQLLCREMHIAEAGIVAITCGGIASYMMQTSFIPVLAAFIGLEAVWLLLTFVFHRQKEQTYTISSHLLSAAGVSIVVGIALSLFIGAVIWPVVIAFVLFWFAWLLLMPM